MTGLTLYTRPGCHLCDDMKAIVHGIAAAHPVTLEEIDISGDHGLERRFGTEIPVLAYGGQVIARTRTTRAALAKALGQIERGRSTDR